MARLLTPEVALSIKSVPEDVRAERQRAMDDFEARRAAASKDTNDALFAPFVKRADWFTRHIAMDKIAELVALLRGLKPDVTQRVAQLLELRLKEAEAEADRRHNDGTAAARMKRRAELDAGAL